MRNNLRAVRKAKGVTQAVLAQRTGMSQSAIANLETVAWNGHLLKHLNTIAKALDVLPCELLHGADSDELRGVMVAILAQTRSAGHVVLTPAQLEQIEGMI